MSGSPPDSTADRPAGRITGIETALALRAGALRVAGGRDELNLINVYPVPDGDTGTNLTATLLAVDEIIAQTRPAGAGDVLAAAADAAIDGARGNSGAIFASFLQGLADAVSGREELTGADLAAAFANGERYARGALDEPQEGTILTVMTAVAATARNLPASLPPQVALRELAARAGTAAAATRGRLPATARANVEDAGARGFVLFLEGFSAGLAQAPEGAASGREPAAHLHRPRVVRDHGEGPVTALRFCTECLVSAEVLDRRRLRDELAPLGNSLVLTGGRGKVRIHIHAADPGGVFSVAARHGRVSGEKADDMLRQSRIATGGSVIVTDSAADLPAEMLDELGIHVVPLRIHLADRTYLDKVSLSPAQFMELLAAGGSPPQTSQPAPGDFRRLYDYLASHFSHVVALTVSGRFSGTLQAARAAARQVADGHRITIIDSRNASLGQGLIARFAAERARAAVPPAVLEEEVRGAIGRTRSFGYVPDLRHAVRGGRLPAGIAWLAGLLGRAPVLEMRAGSLGLRGFIRPDADPVRPFARRIAARLPVGRTYRLAVAHAGAPGEARALLAELHGLIDRTEDSFVTELGPALSVHGGPGTLVVSTQETVVST